jgi:alpha-glucosidase
MKPIAGSAWISSPGESSADAVIDLKEGGQLRLVFLSETMARVTWQSSEGFKEPRTWAIAPVSGQDVAWEGRPRETLAGFDRPKLSPRADTKSLETLKLRVTWTGGEGEPIRLIWTDPANNKPFQSDRVTSAYLNEDRTGLLRHCLERDPSEHYFGLGDKTGPLNLHGRRLRCLGQDSIGYDPERGDPLYKHWPFLITRTVDGLWVGTYYDTLSACTFDLGCEHDNYHGLFRTTEIDDGDLDYYLMVGSTPEEVIAQFVKLVGGTLLPPRWTLGYAQTAMGLADSANAQEMLSSFIDECQYHQVPISAFHYGSGYSSRGKQRYVFTWNTSKFPNPEEVNAKFHAAGMKVVANLKPCLLDDHPAYKVLAEQGAFIEHEASHQPVVEPYWDGQGSHLDFTCEQAVKWWQSQLKTQILQRGIDVGWNDNNEYAIQAEDAISAGMGASLPMHRSRPLHGLLMTRATFESQKAHAQETSQADLAFTITRAGPPGIQRYAQTWSGDNTTSWASLKWNIRTGLQMSLSGMFNIGHDVGGFYGPIPDAELFLRWVQSCSLNPRMVMNSWKAGNVSNLPWMHPEVTQAVIEAIRLRYQLLPYMWQCFEAASQKHVPIIRPTFFNFPNDLKCFEDSDDFMLGDALLVAPVVVQSAITREVYLPHLPTGEYWFDFYDKTPLKAGQRHTVKAPLNQLPLFVKSGAQIPIAMSVNGTLPKFDDPVTEVLKF